MAAPTIIRGSEHMFSTRYVGNGHGQRVGKFVPFTDSGTIAKSVMLDHASSGYLERTQDTVSGDDNKRKATFSWWFKQTGKRFGNETCLFGAAPSGRLFARFDTSQRMTLRLTNSTTEYEIVTNRTFEDTSKWYHCLWQIDASQGTAANRSRLWVDGDEITSWSSAAYPAQNTDVVGLADGTTFRIGSLSHSATQFFDGYIAEFNCISGSIVDVSTFGLTDTTTGRWIPKTLTGITYGDNGFRTTFANTAGLTIGDDTSGNGNDLSVTNIGVDHIQADSPTQNYAKMSASYHAGATNVITEGGKQMTPASGSDDATFFPFKLRTGKFYVECYAHNIDEHAQYILNGIADFDAYVDGGVQELGRRTHSYAWDPANERYFVEGTTVGSSTGKMTQGDIMGIAMDFDNNKLYFSKNGTYILSSNPNTLTGGISFTPARGTRSGYYLLGQSNGTGSSGYANKVSWNVGDNPTFCGTLAVGAAANTDGAGSTFKYTPPTGFKGLLQDNLPTTEKGVPDLVWVKNRDATLNHVWYDTSRGIHKYINSNSTGAQGTDNDGLTKFLKGGFATEDAGYTNTDNNAFVAWNWVANGGTTSANTDGSGANRASTIQANQTAGFSIVTFTSSNDSGFNVDKVAHGLTQGPEWFIFKRTDSTSSWIAYHKDAYASNQHALVLETTAANATFNTELNPSMFPASPDTNIFSYVSGSAAAKGANFVAYCWHSVEGYSKIGKYEGNNNADGPFVHTGFKPAWLLCKDIDNTRNWVIIDNTRDQINPTDKGLFPNDTAVEATGNAVDFLSNGFKCRTTGTSLNAASTYIFVAFADHPFVGDGTNPSTAR